MAENRALALLRRVWPVVSLALILLVIAIAIRLTDDIVLEDVYIEALAKLVVVVGLYIFVGNTGVISFGHPAFMAMGAYATAWLTIPPNIKRISLPNIWPALAEAHVAVIPANLLAGLPAAAFAFLVGLGISRLAGIAAGISTFGLLMIVRVVYSNWEDWTLGFSTIMGQPQYLTIWNSFGWGIFAMVVAFAYQESRLGLAARASREDEVAARATGVNIARQRLIAFVLSAYLVGVGGAIYVHFIGTVSIETFYVDMVVITLVMLIVGGINSLAGAVLGTIAITALIEMLRNLEGGFEIGATVIAAPRGTQEIGLAIVMLLILIYRPKGITGGREITWPFAPRRR
ncbi:MAG: branched-chain amino acid ABC transporter permease [Alphaproteobacteria bacterium]|nr:branched-chain amino acid ABC transporter permease [Alphaproteobacteria bacterium]